MCFGGRSVFFRLPRGARETAAWDFVGNPAVRFGPETDFGRASSEAGVPRDDGDARQAVAVIPDALERAVVDIQVARPASRRRRRVFAHEVGRDRDFLKKTLAPWATDALKFYGTRFAKKDGRIRIYPTHAAGTYRTGVVDDMPSVAGLHEVTARLSKLPPEAVPASDVAYRKRIATLLPPLPKRTAHGGRRPDAG